MAFPDCGGARAHLHGEVAASMQAIASDRDMEGLDVLELAEEFIACREGFVDLMLRFKEATLRLIDFRLQRKLKAAAEAGDPEAAVAAESEALRDKVTQSRQLNVVAPVMERAERIYRATTGG